MTGAASLEIPCERCHLVLGVKFCDRAWVCTRFGDAMLAALEQECGQPWVQERRVSVSQEADALRAARNAIWNLLKPAGAPATCKYRHAAIFWLPNPQAGKAAPFDETGIPHVLTYPQPERLLKRKHARY
jgi:hypothetical protein